MINDIKFSVFKNGLEKKIIIIDRPKINKNNYIIYKEENNNDIYASLYKIKDDKLILLPIENEEDYDIIDNYLERL